MLLLDFSSSHFSTMAGGEGVSAPSAAVADQTGGEEVDTQKAGTKRKAPDSPSPSPADEASAPAPAPTRPKNEYDDIKHCIVTNDGTADSMVKLIGLKSLFARQLPKMPKDYIVRLVFDKRHKSLAILSQDPKHKGGDEEIIGGICYRAYPEMRFAEIAFCAVSASQQVKGYGTKLMNLLKRQMVREGLEYSITYADNYAIGYFKKQGFTKAITMPKGRYHGLIKDYDGGTIMECYVHPSIDFTRVPDMIQAQKTFLLQRVATVAKSHRVVYPALPRGWKPDLTGVSRSNQDAARSMAIPGVAEAGWTLADLAACTGAAKDSDRKANQLKSELLGLWRKTQEQQFAWPFREPVNTDEVPDYLEVIKDPIDLSTIEKRIRKGIFYKTREMLLVDLMRMVNNCKLYNGPDSPYTDCAVQLERYLKSIFPEA